MKFDMILTGSQIMLNIILIITSLCIAGCIADAVLSLSIKCRIQKNLKSMTIKTKRIVQKDSVQIIKTNKMLNGLLVVDQYDLYVRDFLYHVKGPNTALDSVHYSIGMKNFIDCTITYDILICNNIEIHSLGDVYKAFGLKSNEAIDFYTPLWHLLAKKFRILNSIEYDEEILISEKAFNPEDWRESMSRELKQSKYIRKWLFTVPEKYLRFAWLRERLDFRA